MRRVLTAAAVTLAVAGCGAGHSVTISVTPRRSAEYQPVDVRISGLQPGEQVTLAVTSTDAAGVRFASSASFRAGSNGRIDLAKTAWPMGLLAKMTATTGPNPAFYSFGAGDRDFRVTTRAAGRTLATATFVRAASLVPLTTRSLTVARDGFQGVLAAPKDARRLPAVLELGGSEGGPGRAATGLAANGLAVLSVGYFAAPGLPRYLHDIPLEYFRKALVWLEQQPQVDPARVTVMGTSYGSEAALLLGAHYPKLVHAVAAIATGSVSTCGITGAHGLSCLGAAWTFRGKPVPYTRQWDNPHPTDDPAAVIPVERIRGPVFLTCGGLDQVWSSCRYARAIVARLKAHASPYPTTLNEYPGASHYGAQVYRYWPGALGYDVFVPGDERARERLWPDAIAFLKRG